MDVPRRLSVPKCLFFQHLEGLTEVFGQMSAGISGQKLPLWAEFPFLKILGVCKGLYKRNGMGGGGRTEERGGSEAVFPWVFSS